MFGFLTFGAVMTCLDLGLKNWVETQDEAGFPRDVPALKGCSACIVTIIQGFHLEYSGSADR